jgi:hypothetical protein
MNVLVRACAQFIIYVGIGLSIAHFSAAPAYEHLDPNAVLVKMSFSHAAAHREPCRRRTQEELAALAPNMRKPMTCTRERVDLKLELKLDGVVLYAATAAPSGLARDGEATIYEKFIVAPGTHEFDVSMRDTLREAGFDHSAKYAAVLAPGQLLVIDFDATSGGFSFR